MQKLYLKAISIVSFLLLMVAPCSAQMRKVRHHADAADWKLLGTGRMVDGWVTPGLNPEYGSEYDPADYAFDVEVYESVATPGKYKLASPWTSDKFPFLSKNENKEAHDIIIDATDPNFVEVAAQVSGFVNVDKTRTNYSNPFYIGCAGTYFKTEEGYSKEDITNYNYNSTLKDGVITIVSPRFGKAASGNDFGYNWQGEYATVITLPSAAPSEQWVAAGKATYTDGFIVPGYLKGVPADHSWTVDVEESSEQAGLYRLVNPYTADNCPLAVYNENTTPTYIKIDASDPELVVIEPQYSGFSNKFNGGDMINFFVGNDAGVYVANGVSKDDLKKMSSFEGKADVFKDGVITIKEPLYGKDAAFEFGYKWTKGDVVLNYPATITFAKETGVKGIEVNAQHNGAEAVHDLQGVRVQNTAKPGLYIVRKGGKTFKMLRHLK